MKRAAVVSLAIAVSACTSVPVRHVFGTDGTAPDRLAVVEIMTNEVRLLEVDGKRGVPDGKDFNFFIQPGKHKLSFDLTWSELMCAGTVCIPVFTNSSITRSACIEAEAGMIYHFYGKSPGPNWRLLVSKRKTGESDGKDIEHTCPP